MKKIITILICIISFAACDKVYINGELDGMWKLQQVEDSEAIHYPTDIFYSFQRHLTQISKHYEEQMPLRYIGNLYYCGDTVTMSGFRKFLEEEKVATPELLQSFYLQNDSSVLIIERLDDEILVMKCDGRRYSLRRW